MKPTATPEHLITYPTYNTWDKLPPVIIDRDTGMISLETILKINREDEVALNGNDLRVWIYAYVTPYVEGSTHRDDAYNLPPTKLSSTLMVYDVSDFWNVQGKRSNYSDVFTGADNTWQIFKFDLPMPTLMSEIASMRSSGSTNTKYLVEVFTIVGRDNHNPPVPWPTSLTEYEMFFDNANYDYRNVTHLSLKVLSEDDFTLNDVTFYEYGSTSNRTLTISGTATEMVTKDNLVIERLSNTSGDFEPLNIEEVYWYANIWQGNAWHKNVWKAKVTNPNPALRTPSVVKGAGGYYGEEIIGVMKASYTNSTTGTVQHSKTKNIKMRGPIRTRVVNMDSPATTHNIVYNKFAEYGPFSSLPYARFNAGVNTFSFDIVVKTSYPDEIAAMGAGMKLWLKVRLEALGLVRPDVSNGPIPAFDRPIYPWTDSDLNGEMRTGPVYTVGEKLGVIPNVSDFWNNPSVSKPYSDKFPDAPDDAKNWRILTIGLSVDYIAGAVADARAATGNMETDLLLVIETFMARTDMDLPAPYPSTYDGFTEDYYSTFPVTEDSEDMRSISYMKLKVPISA